MKFFSLLLAFLVSASCFSQELLKTSGNPAIDGPASNAIELMTKDAANQFDNAINLTDEALQTALREQEPKGIAVARFAKATVLLRAGSYAAAQASIENAIAVCQKITDTQEKNEMLAYCYQYLGFIFGSQSNWEESLKNYFKGYDLIKDRGNVSQAALLLTKIGDIYLAAGDKPNAEKYFLEALEKDQGKNAVVRLQIYVSYANLLTETRPDSAIAVCNEALALAQKQGIKNKDYNIYFAMAGAYFTKGDYMRAILTMNRAIDNAKINNKPLSQYNIGFAEIYNGMNQRNQAEHYYLQAIEEAKKENNLYMQYQAMNLLQNFYQKTGQNDKQLDLFKKASVLKDSIYSTKQLLATKEMDYRYQTAKKEDAIASLTRANQLKTFLMIASAIAIISVLLLLMNRRKQAGLREKYHQSREKTLLQENFIARQQTEIEKEQKEKAFLREQLQQEENLSLQKEIESTQRELATTTLYIQEKNKVLEQLQRQVNSILQKASGQHKTELVNISRSLKKQMSFENDWNKIKLHFEKVHPRFFEKLSSIAPTLTPNDLKNCAYIKMKLNHKEIANLTALDYNSVKMARYRIKKKLNLEKEEDLNSFIENL